MTMPVRSAVHAFERTRIYPSHYPSVTEEEPVALYNCTADVSVGNLVRLLGDDGTAVATATSTEAYPVLGVVTSKPAANRANVQLLGTVSGVLQGLVPGTTYFLGIGGKMVAPPLTPLSAPYVQRVGMAVAPDALQLSLSGPITHRAGA